MSVNLPSPIHCRGLITIAITNGKAHTFALLEESIIPHIRMKITDINYSSILEHSGYNMMGYALKLLILPSISATVNCTEC